MKIVYILLLALSSLSISSAQTDTIPKWFVGGSINFLYQKDSPINSSPNYNTPNGPGFVLTQPPLPAGYQYTSFGLQAYLGFQLTEKWALSLSLGNRTSQYTTFKSVVVFGDSLDFKKNIVHYQAEMSGRYIINPEGKLDFYLRPFIGYNDIREDAKADEIVYRVVTEAQYFEFGTDLGMLYNFTDRFRANLSVGGLSYIKGKYRNDVNYRDIPFSSFGTRLTLESIHLGVEFSF